MNWKHAVPIISQRQLDRSQLSNSRTCLEDHFFCTTSQPYHDPDHAVDHEYRKYVLAPAECFKIPPGPHVRKKYEIQPASSTRNAQVRFFLGCISFWSSSANHGANDIRDPREDYERKCFQVTLVACNEVLGWTTSSVQRRSHQQAVQIDDRRH